ncbi:cytochrome c [Paucibacter sp. TC2R-5]|uniref:SorU family sulfite dehydrogenase c-type cytochrome subunit n=1 Tax=Paucibacter sp. TC2R-5 TaxID=2893555 RepID=UPI0021E4EB34|nr:cytochrome c [Paucibacter sp. TC2R-5]MCV2360971.1 cytochrome c [Paucibacter sp. TC2R-5]
MARQRLFGLIFALICGLLAFGPVNAGTDGVTAKQAQEAEFELGKRLFTKTAVPACALCHTLRDAASEGAVGPVLDEIKPDADRVSKALRNGLGNMPAFKTLGEAEIKALARYVSQASGGAGPSGN